MEKSSGNRRDAAGHNLLGLVGLIISAVAQPASTTVAHGPQTAITLDKQAVIPSCGNRSNVACHYLNGSVGSKTIDGIASTQLARGILAHGPQTAVALEKQAESGSCGNGRDVAGHNLFGLIDVIGCAVTQLARSVQARSP